MDIRLRAFDAAGMTTDGDIFVYTCTAIAPAHDRTQVIIAPSARTAAASMLASLDGDDWCTVEVRRGQRDLASGREPCYTLHMSPERWNDECGGPQWYTERRRPQPELVRHLSVVR